MTAGKQTSEVGVTGPCGWTGLGGPKRPAGRAAEWSDWLAAHGPGLLLLARQWVPDRADAEDVVQEVFLRFWRARERVTDPAAYLYGSLRGCALERTRGERRRRDRESALAMGRTEDATAAGLFCPIDRAEADERRRLIEAVLDRLPIAQREVLVMKIWGGLTFPQIAAALDVPPTRPRRGTDTRWPSYGKNSPSTQHVSG